MDIAPTKLHPLLTVAAISVTVASLAAVGVFTGILPSPAFQKSPAADVAAPVVANTPESPPPVVMSASQPPAVPADIEQTPEAIPPKPAPKPIVKYQKPVVRTVVSSKAGSVPPPVPSARYASSDMPSVPPDYRPASASAPPVSVAPPTCRECGYVESVREIALPQTQGPGIGAVAGGVLGGVLGHQIGNGRGNDAATVLGAIGGAFAGHQVEKSRTRSVRYEVLVRMDDGTTQVINADHAPAWRGGERVKVVNGAVSPMI